MARRKVLPVSALVALASLAVAAPAASAEPPPDASCLGVLSAFAGQAGTRDLFAPPVSGARVARIASEHWDFNYCLSVFLSP
jgi:hypothetical protein